MADNKQSNIKVPSGIKYINILLIITIISNLLLIGNKLFNPYRDRFLSPIGYLILSSPEIILIIVLFALYRGINKTKYWAWISGVILTSLLTLLSILSLITTKNISSIPLILLLSVILWYLIKIRSYFKSGSMQTITPEEEKIFKYLFLIFFIIAIIMNVIKLFIK